MDYFRSSSVQVGYDENDLVELIQFARCDGFTVKLNDLDIFETLASEVIKTVEKTSRVDKNDFEYGYTFSFPDLGLSFWRPDAEQLHFSAAAIATAGYFKWSSAD